jgi:hypothetical protein
MLPISCVLLTLLIQILTNDVSAQTNRTDAAKSIINVTRNNGGGTFHPGDTLEIRVTVAVLTVGGVRTIIDRAQVFDTIPVNTTYIPGSLRITTNEGILYKGPFTEAAGDDEGTYDNGKVTINLGKNANALIGGRIRSDSSRPSFFGFSTIMVACYRVKIDPSLPYGSIISLSQGSFKFRHVAPSPAVLKTIDFPTYKIVLTAPSSACDDGHAVSAASDVNGTFGRGSTQNRANPLAFSTTYQKVNISNNAPNDYYYAIVNNSSSTGSTNTNLGLPNNNKVFTFWDIIGDHTDAADPIFGNPPAAPGSDGGYMVLINSSYKTDTAYRETLTGLCPNTYYKFSAWVRNICPRCSSDSTGKGSGSFGFKPGPGNDSSGVKPNISFEIDGLIYYTSGDVPYSRTEPWRQYGFVFRTGPDQTSADFLIRNNSPGGGGNDWVLDDIIIAHCGPAMNMNYAPIALGCSANPFYVTLSDTVRYRFADSYIYYKWQKSNVGGTVWNDITTPGATGIGSPTYVNGMYQYVTELPPFLATPADSGTYYRVIVATSYDNLHNECAYTDGSIRLVSTIDCGSVLTNQFTRFFGELYLEKARLKWQLNDETNILVYGIEKSTDGVHFTEIGQVSAIPSLGTMYMFDDEEGLNGTTFYRIKMYNREMMYKYSNIITLNHSRNAQLVHVENPIQQSLRGMLYLPEQGVVMFDILDITGKRLMRIQQKMDKGLQNFRIDETMRLQPGSYILHIRFGNFRENRKIIKL